MLTKRFAAAELRSALAAGVGLVAGTVATLAAQRHTLEALRVRLDHLEHTAHPQHHSNLAIQQRLHWELLSKAMDDQDLAEVLNAYDEDISPRRQRQYLFANAIYTNLLFYYRIGNISLKEFYGHVRGIIQNPIMRDFWAASEPHRASLVQTSDEASLGRMVDKLIQDLEAAETEEWWVVGEPPIEQG
ncbi:DUF6082 family protein [Streptomyces lasiicapitis]|uniref:DUF6082 family protein n=1 Tax=Streptomyces lasiicapitis TaxID=1923961 RepID=UPI003324D809